MLIKTEKSDAIISFLKKKFLVNENIIGIIENLPWAEIYVDNVNDPKGVLVKKDDYMHYVYTEDEAFLDNICENYFKEGFFGFSGVEGNLAEKIRQRYLLGWESRCALYYMPESNFDINLKKNSTSRIRIEDAGTVDHFYPYRNDRSLETIKRDITNRPSSAIYLDDEIVCWVLIHDDNSMGIMYTKEEHRRKGYAIDVTIDLAQQIFNMGKIPFIQIVEGNGMSPGLAKKCGFVEMGNADWFGIIAGNPKELTEANDRNRQQFLEMLPDELHKTVFEEDKIYVGIYYYLHNLKYKPSDNKKLSFAKVETKEQTSQWLDIVIKSLDVNSEYQRIKNILETTIENTSYKTYLMYKDKVAMAATSTLRFDEEDFGIHMVSVLPEYRSDEMMERVIIETLNAEKNMGCFFMVAQVNEEVVDLYKKLGFRESHRFKA